MGKKLSKREKLDLILSEVTKLKSDIRSLEKQQASLVERFGAASARKTPARPKPKAKSEKPAAAKKSSAPPRRPVLVQPAATTGTPPRTAG
jgi:hypothetical protein